MKYDYGKPFYPDLLDAAMISLSGEMPQGQHPRQEGIDQQGMEGSLLVVFQHHPVPSQMVGCDFAEDN